MSSSSSYTFPNWILVLGLCLPASLACQSATKLSEIKSSKTKRRDLKSIEQAGSRPVGSSAFQSFIEALNRPKNKAGRSPAQDGSEAERFVASYAPLIWFHEEERHAPSDPVKFIENSSLWMHRSLVPNEKLKGRGEFPPTYLKEIASHLKEGLLQNEGVFLNYEGETEGTSGQAFKNELEQAPMLWRVKPQHTWLQADGSVEVLIEYWYHASYNDATGVGVGNHEGDWEGIAILVQLEESPDHTLKHRAKALYYASHNTGKWYCPSEIQWNRDLVGSHPEAFSAVGTHATYPREGRFQQPFIVDRTGRGHAWETWKSLRPLTLEPYYGFSGSWGSWAIFSFMRGPLPPGPGFKSFPKSGSRSPAEAVQECEPAPAQESL